MDHRKGCSLPCRGGNPDDEAPAFLGGMGAGFGGGYLRPNRNQSSGLRTGGCKRIESTGLRIRTFPNAVGLVVDDFLMFTTVQGRGQLEFDS